MGRKAKTIPAQSRGLEVKKTSGRGRGIFLDFSFYRTSQVDFGISARGAFSKSLSFPCVCVIVTVRSLKLAPKDFPHPYPSRRDGLLHDHGGGLHLTGT